MLRLYASIMGSSTFLLRRILARRVRRGKEDPARLGERTGIAGLLRPDGPLVWFHAASVGEAQSTLILAEALLARHKTLHVLVTTGTVASAALMRSRLPPRALHQYYPFDHPQWVARFLDHWRPDLALWMESEIWPNMLTALQARGIPAALINARLSPASFRRWRLAARDIRRLLSAFSFCLAQTEEDAALFRELGAQDVRVTDNLKYGAAPLPCAEHDLERLRAAVGERPLWLYASTHAGEEELACRLHLHLRKTLPGLLTIIVPRHPDRRESIVKACGKYGLTPLLRGTGKKLPGEKDGVYIADTLGELGLFYRISPLACIGRSFSTDGGGGHNPIEAAQLGCAVLHGPHVQNLARIYDDLGQAGAAIRLKNEKDFQARLERLLTDGDGLDALCNKAADFARQKAAIRETVLGVLAPLLDAPDTPIQKDDGKETACA